MKLTLENLQNVGAFCGAPVKKKVSWIQDGEVLTADVYVKPLSYSVINADIESVKSGDSPWPRRVALSICDESGTPVFKLSDITGINDDGTPVMTQDDGREVERGALNYSLFDGLVSLVMEVSGLGKARKSSPKKRSSGMS